MHPEHPLTLRVKRDFRCNLCQHVWKDFAYTCSQCYFDMDIVCASAMEPKIDHRSHEHLLTPVRSTAMLRCDACGQKHEGMWYQCTTCSHFWIHRACALLRSKIKLRDHVHHLTLTYALPSQYTFVAYATSDCPEFIGFTIAENAGILPMSHVKHQISRLASASIHLGEEEVLSLATALASLAIRSSFWDSTDLVCGFSTCDSSSCEEEIEKFLRSPSLLASSPSPLLHLQPSIHLRRWDSISVSFSTNNHGLISIIEIEVE
ncbi:hypothetical protein RJ639_004666 [Escallonia herrerae]|uniref:DC1 domain-containing protein n=1 Tax=Escallonia herrerae TaxID=1293975 RepID=A0AA88W1H0_9ASTE|nr:hypothetical protein RJ639_004666 [Escallonia herrerae]